jgi:hypothetical protein
MSQGILVDLLEKAAPKRIHNAECAPDDAFGYSVQGNFILVHPGFPIRLSDAVRPTAPQSADPTLRVAAKPHAPEQASRSAGPADSDECQITAKPHAPETAPAGPGPSSAPSGPGNLRRLLLSGTGFGFPTISRFIAANGAKAFLEAVSAWRAPEPGRPG